MMLNLNIYILLYNKTRNFYRPWFSYFLLNILCKIHFSKIILCQFHWKQSPWNLSSFQSKWEASKDCLDLANTLKVKHSKLSLECLGFNFTQQPHKNDTIKCILEVKPMKRNLYPKHHNHPPILTNIITQVLKFLFF